MRSLRTLPAIFVAALLLTIAPRASAGDTQERALSTVSDMLGNAHSAMNQRGPEALPSAISPFFAFDFWGQFLIKPRATAFTPDQQQTFRSLLPGFMAHLYHVQFQRGLDDPPTVNGVRRVRRDMMVTSQFTRTNGRLLPVEWRMRQVENDLRIIDIMIGGTSFMLLKRDEFTSIVDNGGPDALLDYLRRNSY